MLLSTIQVKVNVWDRNSTGKIFAITDDYGGEEAVTTIMWADEY